jgi:anti-anti-sigma factor
MAQQNDRHMTSAVQGAALVVSITEAALRDAPTCYALRDEIVRAIDSVPVNNMVVDLASVEFIGSVGFLAFLGARRRLGAGRIILCGMSDNIRELFRACALISSDPSKPGPFEEAASTDSALAML